MSKLHLHVDGRAKGPWDEPAWPSLLCHQRLVHIHHLTIFTSADVIWPPTAVAAKELCQSWLGDLLPQSKLTSFILYFGVNDSERYLIYRDQHRHLPYDHPDVALQSIWHHANFWPLDDKADDNDPYPTLIWKKHVDLDGSSAWVELEECYDESLCGFPHYALCGNAEQFYFNRALTSDGDDPLVGRIYGYEEDIFNHPEHWPITRSDSTH